MCVCACACVCVCVCQTTQLVQLTVLQLCWHVQFKTAIAHSFVPDPATFRFLWPLSHSDSKLEPPQSLSEFCARVVKIPLLFQPGERFRYSSSTDMLGYLVECVAKQPLGAYFKQHIFDPLGMSSTGYVFFDLLVSWI